MVPENSHTHPKDGHRKFRGGSGGISMAKIFKGKSEAKLKISKCCEGSNQNKTFLGEA